MAINRSSVSFDIFFSSFVSGYLKIFVDNFNLYRFFRRGAHFVWIYETNERVKADE